MSRPSPDVLAINICDTIIRDEHTKKVSLMGLFSVIWASGFPCTHPLMHVYVALTGGHGKHEIEVRLSLTANEQMVMSMKGPVEFTSPLQVIELNLAWQRVTFKSPGEYAVEVFSDGSSVPVGRRKFNVREQAEIPPTSGSEAI